MNERIDFSFFFLRLYSSAFICNAKYHDLVIISKSVSPPMAR